MGGIPEGTAKPQVEKWLPNPPTHARKWARSHCRLWRLSRDRSPQQCRGDLFGVGGWGGTVVPVCPQTAEPLRVLLICVASKTHPETGGSVPRGCPLE